MLCFDSLRLNQILINLLSNALKFTPEDGTISVDVTELPSEKDGYAHFRFCVSDNGIGISAADLPRVFDKGFTGENGRRYSKSTGIGLYLSQKLCKKMNIVLSVSSDPGQGTTVTMVFPTESYLKEAGL